MNEFNNFKLDEITLENIEKQRIIVPTLIQKQSIPLILEGKDVIGESATGSGKTLAFGCGIVEKIKPNAGLQALILTPTRELAEQVKNSIKKLTNKLRIIAVYGGVSINPQIDDLEKAEVVIATPGRMMDHMERGTINLSKINFLVLDEADRMLDMGFIDAVENIVRQCPKKRQTLFFSATITNQVKNLAARYMIEPVKVQATRMVDPKLLKQVYYNINKNMKLSLLITLLENEKAGLVMVFCNTRRSVDFVVKTLKLNRIDAMAIHGGLSQNKRAKTLSLFNHAKVEVLVCTDIAARGLHIDNVSHIYNYEIPKDSVDYVHRIGRTARAGESGKVVNILADYDHDSFRRVMYDYKEFKIASVDIPPLKRIIAAKKDSPRRFDNRNQGNFRRRYN